MSKYSQRIRSLLVRIERDYVYLGAAVVLQVLFWYTCSPGPQLAVEHVPSFGQAASRCLISVLLLVLIPLALMRVYGDPWGRLGLGVGDASFGLKATALLAPTFAFLAVLGSGDRQMQAFYPWPGGVIGESWTQLGLWFAIYAAYYVAFEFFYRGFLLNGLPGLGLRACFALQVSCSVLIHVGKPPMETLASIPAAVVFGWLAIRSRSLLYVFLVHFVVGMANDLAVLYRSGAPILTNPGP